MTLQPIDKSHIAWLRDRWDSRLINRIVIALNEGCSIESLLDETPQNSEISPARGRLDLRGIDLSHQNLRGPWEFKGDQRHRSGVKLNGADLSYSILAWVILPKADLRGAIMKGTDLSNAELIYADLSDTDMTDACLKDAWLLDTLFHGGNISKAQLSARRNLGQLDFDYHAYEI